MEQWTSKQVNKWTRAQATSIVSRKIPQITAENELQLKIKSCSSSKSDKSEFKTKRNRN
jgi:Holliday junction resolvase RusA-like endonuclease